MAYRLLFSGLSHIGTYDESFDYGGAKYLNRKKTDLTHGITFIGEGRGDMYCVR